MVEGYWYPKGSATRYKAHLEVNDLGRYAISVEEKSVYRGEVSMLKLSERLGNVERKVTLEDGSTFTSLENDKIDELFQGHQKVSAFIHYLETHYRAIVLAVVVTLASGFSFFKWGIPWASAKIAHALPYETNELIASGSMEFLDNYMFDQSAIAPERQEEISTHFYTNLVPLTLSDEKEVVYKLHFRSWTIDGEAIPNALALPSGDIILTDKFVELCQTQEEMDAVLFHEMGHVVHRHSLEMMIQGTFITVAVMMMTGEASGLGDLGIGLGTALVTAAYSRGHESEADVYAFEKMLKVGIDPKSFSTIMNRLTTYMDAEHNQTSQNEETFLDYFSSHPNTQERVEIANRYSECFNKGLTVCK